MEANIENIFLKKIKKYSETKNFKFSIIRSGRNNKVILASTPKVKYIIKYYTKRNFFNSHAREKLFLNILKKKNIKNVPKYLFSINKNISVISYLKGKLVSKINNFKIIQTIKFINKINKNNKEDSISIPKASDACFSIKEHVDLVDKKIKKLQLIVNKKYKNSKIFRFLKHQVIPKLRYEKKYLKQNYIQLYNQKLKQDEIIISPSDLGFHNMLENKKIFFIDFEYAGIDDPAKLMGDFICQPDLQLNKKQIQFFIKNFHLSKKNLKKIKNRSKILLNMHRLKWCATILNYYLPSFKAKRKLSGLNHQNTLEKQLNKSIKYFNKYF